MHYRFSTILVFVVSFLTTLLPAHAHDGHTHASASASMSDEQAIEHSMKKLFDKPDAPLTVAPVTLDADYAVAGWIQSGKGGRALLKKEKGQWHIQVCGGDGLKQAAALVQTGMSPAAAERMAQKIQLSEAKLSAEHLKKLAMFDGLVKVQATGHEAHAAHPKH